MEMMRHYLVTSIGENKGAPRVWLQGSNLDHVGFKPGTRFDIKLDDARLVLTRSDQGIRVVSRKRRGESEYPVIDINSRELLEMFEGMSAVRVVMLEEEIHILPLASELRRQERVERTAARMGQGDPLEIGSLSHGGGIMCHAIHAGLYREGLDSRLIFANEIRPELLDHAREVNDCWESDTVGIAAPMQELAFDRWAMAKLPDVDILEAGIPCSGASLSGRSKRKLGVPEDHPEVGHLAVAFLAIVAAVNPLVVVLENVPQYRDTASGAIIRSQLRDLGYAVHEVVLSGESFNAVEDRKRYCMVAVTNGVSFSMNDLAVPDRIPITLGDALDEVDDDDPRWSTMPGLKAKQERDKEAGKGFMMQVFDGGSTRIGTITKGYAKVRSTDPKIRHPRNPDLLRQLTAGEHARVKQIPERLIDGLCETTAHEVLGQSVIYRPFMAIGALIANALKRWAIEGPSGCQQGDAALIACG